MSTTLPVKNKVWSSLLFSFFVILFSMAMSISKSITTATLFTVAALGFGLYYLAKTLFGEPSDAQQRDSFTSLEPLPPPVAVELGEVTEEELKGFDGTDPKKPLLMAIKGQIYDVSQSRMFYGPGGPYAPFAGKDASRALAKMSFNEADMTGDISGLGAIELDALQDWENKFMSKYIQVGTITKNLPM